MYTELFVLFFFIIIVLEICLLLNIWLRYKIPNNFIRIPLVVFISVASTLGGAYIALFILYGNLFEQPIITKTINSDYCFTRQEYGAVFTSTEGTFINIYEHHYFWPNKKIGHIYLLDKFGNMNMTLKNTDKPDYKKVTILQGDTVLLDTVLNFNHTFDFDYTK